MSVAVEICLSQNVCVCEARAVWTGVSVRGAFIHGNTHPVSGEYGTLFSKSPEVHTSVGRGQAWESLSQKLPPLQNKNREEGSLGCCFSLRLPDLFSSWKLSWGWKEWRLGWPGGLGREAGENTFQILIKSLFVVCSLKSLLSVWVSHFSVSLPAFLPHIPPFPFSVTWLPFLGHPLSKFLSVSLSPNPSIFLPLLSASTSVCLSLPVLVHLSVSLHLPVRGCLCPSALPPICLVVCCEWGCPLTTKAPSSRSAKVSPGSGCGEGVQSCSFWKLQ